MARRGISGSAQWTARRDRRRVNDSPRSVNVKFCPALLACFERPDWAAVSYDVRLTILHELNTAITCLREQQGLPPFDDGVPGERDNVFRRIKDLMFAAPPGAHPGLNQMEQANSA